MMEYMLGGPKDGQYYDTRGNRPTLKFPVLLPPSVRELNYNTWLEIQPLTIMIYVRMSFFNGNKNISMWVHESLNRAKAIKILDERFPIPRQYE